MRTITWVFPSHPKDNRSGEKAIDERGYDLSSVRFICGTQDGLEKMLEKKISEFWVWRIRFLYVAAFDANANLFEPLFNEKDEIISDALNHASLIDGMRLCKTKKLRYEHIDMVTSNLFPDGQDQTRSPVRASS